ncbi:HlyD family efflux transporter periplasmic adaptor subunit [candidate division KSB1 bacterium]|nr:HlyD family efflux transporter periplasmic adaptor subunit [candidate division KSB1 bacterium]
MNKNRLFGQILNSLEEGILTINMDGNITFCNKAAKLLLNLSNKILVGRSYSKIFLAEPKNEAFYQIISDAIEAATLHEQHRIPYRSPDGRTYPLIINTSFISSSTEFDELSDNQGVVVSIYKEISDAGTVAESSETSQEHVDDLRRANVRLEHEKEKAKKFLRRIEFIKIGLTFIIFALFLGVIMYLQNSTTLDKVKLEPVNQERGPGKIINVMRDTMEVGITLSGPLQPYSTVTLAAQTAGKVIRRNFKEGDQVQKEQILYELERKEVARQVRSARVAYMKLLEQFNELKSWEGSLEVKQAQRKFELAKLELANEKKKLAETRKLFEKGIIPRIEFEQAQTAYKKLQYNYKNAEESLEKTIAKGESEKLEVLRLQLFNSKEELMELEKKYEATLVRAPVAGVVMEPVASDGTHHNFKNEGDMVKGGDLMATIGATESYRISAMVGDLNVKYIRAGQPVSITSFAFPGIALKGEIERVSAKAIVENKIRYFPVRIMVPAIPDSLRNQIRLGMLTDCYIPIDTIPDTLVVPLEAIFRHNHKDAVYAVMPDNSQEIVYVKTGLSNEKNIIVTHGLADTMKIFIRDDLDAF